jgi:ubiquinol-cytochrome c reductase iron-sulfur subunit
MDDRTKTSSAPGVRSLARRDVLRVATGAAGAVGVIGAVGAAMFLVPRLDEGAPGASDVIPGDTVSVDLAPIEPGQQITLFWRTWPVLVVRRTPAMLATLRQASVLDQLVDPDSRQLQQPPYAGNAARSARPEIAVLVGVCTHMGCTPQFYPQPSAREPEPDWIGGYLCPCHGSKYDLAGRVYKGSPALYNLPVPPHRFLNDRTLLIGENPAGAKFEFGSIVQI